METSRMVFVIQVYLNQLNTNIAKKNGSDKIIYHSKYCETTDFCMTKNCWQIFLLYASVSSYWS